MKINGILHPDILSLIGKMGHTDTLVIADAGLPIPQGVERIDLALIKGIPSFMDTLQAVLHEFYIESCTIASEMQRHNGVIYDVFSVVIKEAISGAKIKKVSHEHFKKLCASARGIIRTGEVTPYANVILSSGVTF